MSLQESFKVAEKVNRNIGSLPKIGIRPAIDGRRNGIRESLEDVTMNLAKSVAALLTANLRHPNGEAVECVIADTCIGGVAESAMAAAKFAKEGVGVSITVSPCWCYGAETMDMDPLTPKAVWGFNGTERPGAVYLASVAAAHAQKGLPVFKIYGHDVQDVGDPAIPEDVKEKLLQFARAGLAVANMRGKTYLALGGVSMGIMGSYVDMSFFESYLGMRVQTLDMSEFVRRFEEGIYDPRELERATKWVKAYCKEGPDNNAPQKQHSRERKEQDWDLSIKMALMAKDMMVGNPALAERGFGEESLGYNAIAAGFQGQRQWTDHFPNGDFMEAILNSSFDWSGIRQPFIMATENDSCNGASMLFGHLLTNTAQIFADVRTYWSPEAVKRVTGYTLEGAAASGFIHLINSGAAALDGTGQQEIDGKPVMKPWWEVSSDEAKRCLDVTLWRPGSLDYFRGGGWSSNFNTRGGMPCTMTRLNIVKGIGPVLQIAEGETIELPADVHEKLANRTDPTWPTTWFVPNLTGAGPFADVYSVMNNWGANHGAISYGHIGTELIALAAMLRIPVSMHNVPAGRIFRPSTWAAFGTQDAESSDYRACQALGPVYGRY